MVRICENRTTERTLMEKIKTILNDNISKVFIHLQSKTRITILNTVVNKINASLMYDLYTFTYLLHTFHFISAETELEEVIENGILEKEWCKLEGDHRNDL